MRYPSVKSAPRMNRVIGRGCSAALLAACTVVAVGCNRNPHGIVPVEGVVTFNGGTMPGKGTVYFTQVDSKSSGIKRPALGRFETDGAYEATTIHSGDGVLPGTYAVKVHCWERPPKMGGPPPISYIPEHYLDEEQSGLQLVVEPGSDPIEFRIDIQGQP